MNAKSTIAVLGAVVGVIGLRTASATPFLPGDVLVSGSDNSGSFVKEFTRTGTLVQRLTVPSGGMDLVVDRAGNAQIALGAAPTNLFQLNPTTLATQTTSYPGLSTVGNTTYGGISTFGHYVFVADNQTAGAGDPRGIVRFDLDGGPTVRFAGNPDDPIDLSIGLDGKLYSLTRGNAINAGGTRVDVYDPLTLAFDHTVNLPAEQRGIAVDANGDIYAAQFHGGPNVFRYSATGVLLDQLPNITIGQLGDIDIAPDGTIVAASPNGSLLITDRSLDTYTSFSSGASGLSAFVAIVPEPTTLLASILVPSLMVRRRRRA